MPPSSSIRPEETCSGRTCLKWSPDGSLSDFDKDELTRRLCEADPEFGKSDACSIKPKASLQSFATKTDLDMKLSHLKNSEIELQIALRKVRAERLRLLTKRPKKHLET